MQNRLLTGNPQVTFFKSSYQRHSATEMKELQDSIEQTWRDMERVDKYVEDLKNKRVPLLDDDTEWICAECGFGFMPETYDDTRCAPCTGWGPTPAVDEDDWADPNEAPAW